MYRKRQPHSATERLVLLGFVYEIACLSPVTVVHDIFQTSVRHICLYGREREWLVNCMAQRNDTAGWSGACGMSWNWVKVKVNVNVKRLADRSYSRQSKFVTSGEVGAHDAETCDW